jgi:hypothetical protein
MLSFKQYLREQANSPKPNRPRAYDPSIPEASQLKGKQQDGMMPKWDLIRMIAEDPAEIVQVDFQKEGVWFAFVENEPKP